MNITQQQQDSLAEINAAFVPSNQSQIDSLAEINKQFGPNPVITSTENRNEVDSLENEITDKVNDTTELEEVSQANIELIQKEKDAALIRREEEVARIEREFEEAQRQQEGRQEKTYAGRSTGLITAGGGFLGGTQSHQGVLQNLKETFQVEKNALLSKKQAAIGKAKAAFEEKDFKLARELADEATRLEQELYNRQQEYADDQLAIAREERAASNFERDYANKDKAQKITAELIKEGYTDPLDIFVGLSDAGMTNVDFDDVIEMTNILVEEDTGKGTTAEFKTFQQFFPEGTFEDFKRFKRETGAAGRKPETKDSGLAKDYFTKTQIANGSKNSKKSISEFGNLPIDEANKYVKGKTLSGAGYTVEKIADKIVSALKEKNQFGLKETEAYVEKMRRDKYITDKKTNTKIHLTDQQINEIITNINDKRGFFRRDID